MMVAIRCKRTHCIMGDTNYIREEQYNILVSKLAKNLSVLTLYTLINMLVIMNTINIQCRSI